MQLYKTQAGAYLGFYQEQGGAVVIVGYRTVTKKVWVQKWVTETYQEPDWWSFTILYHPGHWKDETFLVPEVKVQKTRVVAGYYKTKSVWVKGHYETKEIWIPAHDVWKFVDVDGYYEDQLVQLPGQYEIQNVWTEAYFVTRYYWQEAHPARGLEGMWKPYQLEIPAGYKDQRVWVDGPWVTKEVWIDNTIEYKLVTIPGQFTDHRVWVDGNYEDHQVWVPPTTETYTVTIAEHYDTKKTWIEPRMQRVDIKMPGKFVTKKHFVQGWEDVETQEPIYAYYGENDKWDMVDHKYGPVMVIAGPWEGDELTIRVVETGALVKVEVQYVGLAEKTDENEYIIPVD